MPEMDFHLLHPQAFWLLLVLPAVIFMIWRRVRSSASWSRVIDPHLLPHLMTGTGETRTSRNHWWTVIWLALAVLAIAGPSFSKIDVPVFQRADALVIVLDLSASMAAADIQPSRVQRAKQKIMDLLAERDEGVTGLVVYAGDAHVVAPLTDDRRTIENLLTALSPDIMPLPGSNPTEALERALSLLQTAGAASGQILLMTDGMPKFEPALIADQLDAAIDIAILGIGTGTGAPIPRSDGGFLRNDNGDIVIPGLDAAALQAHATALGGRFSRISLDNSDIDSLLTIPGSMDSGEIALDRETDAWLDQGNWIALLLALVLLPLFRRGAMAALLIMPLMTPGTARAQTLDFLWQTPDQRAATVLEAGDPATAATLFENPAWRGTANYGAGNWNNAAEDFKETDDPDNWYNQGNALAKAGDLQGALEAYDRTLAAQPDAEDAIKNRDIVEQLLQQQQQQEGQEGSDGNQDQSEGDSQDNAQDSGSNSQDQSSQQQADSGESNSSEQGNSSQGESGQQQPGNPGEEQAQQSQANAESQDGSNQNSDALSQEMQARLDEQTEEQMGKFNAGLEKQQALEQWLRRVPDDPGGLLQRKFRYETIQRLRQGEEPDEDVRW